MKKIPQGLISFDHVVEGIDGEVVIDDVFLAFIFLVGVFEIDIYYFLYLPAALLQFDVVFVYVVHHHAVESVVFVGLEGVLVEDRLGVLPDVFLDVLGYDGSTVTRIRMSWSR